MKRTLILILISLFWVSPLHAQTFPFVISDIRVEGVQQVDLGTVFRNFPLSTGDQVDAGQLSAATRQLFRSGFFDDVQLSRDGDVLVLMLRERPAVAIIRIEGNKALKEEQLREGLKQSGLQEGDVFRRATLDQIELDLMRVYASQGRYGANVTTEVEDLPGNRVALNINITEGRIATIQHINVVGNQAFSDEELLDLFSLKLPNWSSFWKKDDHYSREKLSGDLERLRSYYLDRGFINFSIDSTQVSVSPDKQDVFITVGITEGHQFLISEVLMIGNLVVPEAELLSKMSLGEGDVFSRREMTDSQQRLERLHGDQGFMFANVSPIPQVDETAGTVSLRYFIEPGKPTYVRRINVRGNTRSADEVVRREIEQMESGIVSTSAIERSKARLERTGHFRTVNVETRPVPGTDDQIDLEFSVEEQQSGQLSASIGFSQSEGIIIQLGVSQDNFLGSGKSVGFNISNSSTLTEYSLNYLDPYYTVDGVSRGFNFYYREENYDEDDRGDYNTDGIGGGVTFGYPIDDFQRLSFSGDVEYLRLKINDNTAFRTSDTFKVLDQFVKDNGDEYLNWRLTAGWSDNRLNRAIYPTSGRAQGATLEVSVPGSDLEYYRAQYNNRFYWPLNNDETWVASLRSRVGYADSYGSVKDYPFFKNFYAGGLTTIRGFEANSLGPRYDREQGRNPRSMGGNVLVAGSAELIFPMPFLKDKSAWRTLVFMDAGNVFTTKCLNAPNISNKSTCIEGVDFGELRYSAGIGLSWLTPVGPLSISLAKPLNSSKDDDEEVFQFVLGQSF